MLIAKDGTVCETFPFAQLHFAKRQKLLLVIFHSTPLSLSSAAFRFSLSLPPYQSFLHRDRGTNYRSGTESPRCSPHPWRIDLTPLPDLAIPVFSTGVFSPTLLKMSVCCSMVKAQSTWTEKKIRIIPCVKSRTIGFNHSERNKIMDSADFHRPHRTSSINSSSSATVTSAPSELFICFTSRFSSSSSMKLSSSKSILSPARARDAPPPAQISLTSSLSRRLRSNGSLKGGQASPMFHSGTKKRGGGGFENPEPSSPKVTCIGQVRVRSKKQGKKLRTRSKRREVSLTSSWDFLLFECIPPSTKGFLCLFYCSGEL